MSDNPKHVTVRLRVPPELRDKIAASSEQYNRSMNADMVARLEKSFEYDATLPKILDDQLENALDTIQNFRGLLKTIKNLQEQVEKQNQLLESLTNKNVP